MLDFDYREVRVSRAIVECARQTILVADSMKLERTAPVRIGHISKLDFFVTDRAPSTRLRHVCHENHVKIEIADPQ